MPRRGNSNFQEVQIRWRQSNPQLGYEINPILAMMSDFPEQLQNVQYINNILNYNKILNFNIQNTTDKQIQHRIK